MLAMFWYLNHYLYPYYSVKYPHTIIIDEKWGPGQRSVQNVTET